MGGVVVLLVVIVLVLWVLASCIRIVTLSFVITGCGGKSTTCSFKLTLLATRSMIGTLK